MSQISFDAARARVSGDPFPPRRGTPLMQEPPPPPDGGELGGDDGGLDAGGEDVGVDGVLVS